MGWSWSETIEQGLAIKRDHFQETKGAINSISNDLQISEFNWQELPVNVGDFIKTSHIEELQDATDYINDWNYCHGENTSDYNTYHDSEEDSFDSTDRGTYNFNRDSFENSGEDNDYNGTERGTYNWSRDTLENSNEDNSENGEEEGTFNGGNYADHKSGRAAFVDSTDAFGETT